MFGHSITSLTLLLSLISQSGFGQLQPDSPGERPQHPAAVKLLDEIITQRSQLKLTDDIDSLRINLAVVGRLILQTKQARELEIRKLVKNQERQSDSICLLRDLSG